MTFAIFGGSFNPITNAHLDIIKQVTNDYTACNIVVSPENPFKDNLISFEDRINMLELGYAEYILSDETHDWLGFDLGRRMKKFHSGQLRSWHMLEHIKTHVWKDDIEFIFGQDMEKEIDSFERIDYIRENASIRFIPEANIMHATDVRGMIKSGNEEWKTHVPKSVADYIEMHNLYKD